MYLGKCKQPAVVELDAVKRNDRTSSQTNHAIGRYDQYVPRHLCYVWSCQVGRSYQSSVFSSVGLLTYEEAEETLLTDTGSTQPILADCQDKQTYRSRQAQPERVSLSSLVAAVFPSIIRTTDRNMPHLYSHESPWP